MTTDNPLMLERGPHRLESRQVKIGRERTGFNGSIFVHVDFDPATGKIWGVRLSEKKKDGSALEKTLRAIGDDLTETIQAIQREFPLPPTLTKGESA